MSVSIVEAQRDVLLSTIHRITRGDWKVMVVDRESRRLIDNVLEEDAILNENITNIEDITDRRPTNRDVDALYFLTPKEHIVDCLMADFQKRKYHRSHLVWTALLRPSLRERIDQSTIAREQIAQFTTLNVEFFPRESHLVTFRDPWSFPILFHPACNHLVRQHMEDVAQKIVGVCVALGEYPTIRYYRPAAPTHEASILCSHLARFVQDELDLYAKFHNDFPPPSSQTRPRGALYIVDRSMDLFAPFVHEFTYQAMAHDLLPIKDGDTVTFRTTINEGQRDQEEKDIPITEKDRIWTENRHRHMKDVIEKLMADFQKFLKDNPNFTTKSGEEAVGGRNGLNAIKDMMAGLPQFQELKEAYALHLGMAQESMNRFQRFKLSDISAAEQTCATGLDEDYKRSKHLADQVVRLLDEDGILPPDRLRLLVLYLLYKDGLLPADTQKLLAHAQLPPSDQHIISNLELVGARTTRQLKDPRPPPPPLFPRKPIPQQGAQEEVLISRYEPVLQRLLEAHCTNTLDPNTFPYTKPPLDLEDSSMRPSLTATSSLRSVNKPTWARSRTAPSTENRQRVIVFAAGGATYSESRACYDVGRAASKEIFLVTSHMLTPALFMRQIADLSADRRRLGIPADAPKEKAPAHLFEADGPPPAPVGVAQPQQPQQQQPQRQAQPQPQQVQMPTQAMAGMNLNGAGGGTSGRLNGARPMPGDPTSGNAASHQQTGPAKLTKEEPKKEKKRHKFGFGK
ncbi:Sec1-like protein [Neohortaea acidophila]|uniref:Sec1-like protein n=1 Tax=Neohortaea acidophila TaxID=245834 RepID=A0A6A6PUS1_9PEZI|nr:Sec1-like protein [Neohortaea acidophila]KAF2483183.1 Sec1-like protein [Neohortaea acidophila]